MDRLKASAIHLCISLLVVGTIAACIFLVWYPGELWHVAGLDHLFVVMLGIDVVAGPLLTLIVYNRAKPELRRDLLVVALLQLGFLGYGLHTAWASRPVFLVGALGRMTLVYANEIDDAALAGASNPEWTMRSWRGPVLVGAQRPVSPEERQALLMSALTTGVDLEQSPKYYVPYARVAAAQLAAARRIEGLRLAAAQDAILDEAVVATGKDAADLRALPIVSARGEGTVLLDAAGGTPLRTLPVVLDSAGPAPAVDNLRH